MFDRVDDRRLTIHSRHDISRLISGQKSHGIHIHLAVDLYLFTISSYLSR